MTVYFDCNAGSPLQPMAEEAMEEAVSLLRAGGNPSAIHRRGHALRSLLDQARERVAALLDADAESLTFTAGATDGAARVLDLGWDLVVQSGLEHAAVRSAVRGATASLPVRPNGVADLDALPELLEGARGRVLVAMLAACGETGVLQPAEEAAHLTREAGGTFLCDATQALGKRRFSCRAMGGAWVVASAHKLGGPPGIGVLVAPQGVLAAPTRRAGTDNVIGIVGFGGAALAAAQETGQSPEPRDTFESRLRSLVAGVRFYGAEAPRLPGASCFSIPGWDAETLAVALDLEGFAVGTGAACASGRGEPMRAPLAMGFGEEDARAAVRVSAGREASRQDWERLADALAELAERRQAA